MAKTKQDTSALEKTTDISKISKGEATKLRMIDAAVKIVGTQGIDKLTFENVASEAKVTRQLVKNYFPQKADLVIAFAPLLRRSFQDHAIKHMKNATTPYEMLQKYAESVFDFGVKTSVEGKAWVAFFHYASVLPAHHELNTEFSKFGQERIAQIIQLGAAHGLFHPSHAEAKAKLIQSTITGVLVVQLTEKLDKKTAKVMFDLAVKSILDIARQE